MTRPVLDRTRALEYAEAAGILLLDQPVIALGIRGALDKGAPNKIGGFDDILAVLTSDICEAFTGNTDPSTEIPGRANLVAGVSWFKPGFHHRDTPKQYPAFAQDGPLTVVRWKTEDVAEGTIDERGKCLGGGLWLGDFAIHIHNAMGVNTTGSEGCQTLIMTEWPEYHELLLGELTKRNLSRFPYVLVAAT